MGQGAKPLVLKTKDEIELMRQSANLLGKTHGILSDIIQPGLKTKELDNRAFEFIKDNGATPSFKGYNGFLYTLCISVNEVVVHGFPSDYELKEGDIISVDCGVNLNGYHADSAFTYWVGNVDKAVFDLCKATYQSLYLGVAQTRAGNRIGDIGFAVQNYVEGLGYSVVRELVGHGIGKSLHEAPEVPNYGTRGKGVTIKEGMVIAIEPMINLGKKQVVQERDGWTIRTSDRKPSAHYEHTVAVVNGEPEILTTFEYINSKFNLSNA